MDPKSREKDRQMMLYRCCELGWDCIAWNVSAQGKVNSSSIAHLKPIPEVMLDVVQLRGAMKNRALAVRKSSSSSRNSGKETTTGHGSAAVRQMSRLTISVDEVVDAQTLTCGNEALRKFDIVAACPGNGKVFAFLCTTAEVDIICLDFDRRLPFSLNKKLLDTAVARGITFEIGYGGMLGSSGSVRKEILAGSQSLLQYLNGKNVILSSAAQSVGAIRGPMDAANIGMVLGLAKGDAERATSKNCARVMHKAMSRRLGHLPVEVVQGAAFRLRWPERGHSQAADKDTDSKGEGDEVKKEAGGEAASTGGDGGSNNSNKNKNKNKKKKRSNEEDSRGSGHATSKRQRGDNDGRDTDAVEEDEQTDANKEDGDDFLSF
jgi:RNase P/RNase MRP subunit p30